MITKNISKEQIDNGVNRLLTVAVDFLNKTGKTDL
jgi:hypothetical protein